MARLIKQGKVWYLAYDDYIDGKRVQRKKSLKTKSKFEAKHIFEDYWHKIKTENLGITNTRIKVNEAINEFLEYKESTLRESSFVAIRKSIQLFQEHIKKGYLLDINLNDLNKMEAKLIKIRSPRTVNKYFDGANVFFKYCINNKWLRENPLKGRKSLPEPQKEIKYYHRWEMDLIEEYMQKYMPEYYPMVMFLRDTGVRRDEMRFAKKSWIKGDHIHISNDENGSFTTKTGQERSIKISTTLKPVIDKLMGESEGPYLFGDLYKKSRNHPIRQIEKICKIIQKEKGKVIKAGVHKYRHAFAVVLLSTGKHSLEVIGNQLGHKDPSTTKIYAKFLPNSLDSVVEDLRRN